MVQSIRLCGLGYPGFLGKTGTPGVPDPAPRYTRDNEGKDVAKKAATTVDTDDVVSKALVTLATAEGPMRLVGKGEHPALFPSAAGANKAALERIKEPNRPLIVEVGSGRTAVAQFTPAGFEFVASRLPEEQVGQAALKFARTLQSEEQVDFLQTFLPRFPQAAPELAPLLAEAVSRQNAEVQARIESERRRAERAETVRAAFERCMANLNALRSSRIEELQQLLIAAGGNVPVAHPEQTQGTKPSTRPPAPSPDSDEDRDFRRDMAERLVSSWRDAVTLKKEEAKQFLETALENISGIRRIGEVGDQVPFDGALHENIPGVFTNHPVRVTRSGWALEEADDREYVIQKAQVSR
jgi:hypothetical protein